MQKYIEELEPGDCFKYQDHYWICGSDFKKDGSRVGISLITGFFRWLEPQVIVDPIELYTLDNNSTIIPIKERKKDDNNF